MAGIAFLRKLLMKKAMKESAPFQHEGIMSISKSLSSNVDTKVKRWVESAKKQGQDIDKMGEQEIKYIVELNKPKGPMIGEHRVIDATSPEGEILTRDLFNMLDRQSGKNVIKTDFGGGVTDIVTETITKIKVMKPIDGMKEANSVLARKGKYKNLTEEQSQKIIKDTEDHIFERNVDVDPEDFAHGGRTGSGLNYLLGEDDQNSRVPYSKGSGKESWTNKLTRWGGGPSMVAGELGFEGLHQIYQLLGMGGLYAEGGRTGFGIGGLTRRAFLKMMGAGAAGVGAAKTGLFGLLKSGKPAAKVLTSVPIKAGVDGMPVWFKPLVNKVIKEGDDVTKKFSTMDREIVHAAELPGSKTKVLVSQDITTGNVAVDIGYGKHGFSEGHLGQPVRLEYKASEVIEPSFTKNKQTINKAGKTKEEFWVEEAEFTGGHPENIKFEETISEKFGSHGSNFDEVEKFATGKIKKKTGKASIKAEREHMVPEGDDMPDYEDFASGGRVPLGKGKIVKGIMSLGKKKKPKKIVLSDDDFNVAQGLDDLENMRGTKAGEIMRIKMKYPGISDDLIRKIMTDDNPQRKAEVFATMDEAFKMQEKGMGPEEIIETFKGTTRTKNETGGRVPLAEGNTPSDTQLEQYYRNLEEEKKRRRLQKQLYEQRFGGPGPVLEAASGGLAGMLGE